MDKKKKCYKNSSSINLNSLISLQHSLLTFNTPYRTFIRLHGSNMAFYLYREPSAIYAVFWACWSITLAPVKLHLLSLKAPWQSSPCYKVLILQEYSNWRKKEKENRIKQGKKISTLVLRQGKADYSSKNMVYRSSDGQSKVRKIISVPIIITRILICLLFYFFPNDN